MPFDPEQLPDILDKHLNMLNQQNGRSPEEIQAQPPWLVVTVLIM